MPDDLDPAAHVDAPDESPQPDAPVRVLLAGGGHHPGLPAGLFLGAPGTFEALRYPDGRLELVGLSPAPEAPADAPEATPAPAPRRARSVPVTPDPEPPAESEPASEPAPAAPTDVPATDEAPAEQE